MSEREPKSVSTRETILNVIVERNRLRAEIDQLREALRELLELAEAGQANYQYAQVDADAILSRARAALGDTPDE